jgi:hypothetical protein
MSNYQINASINNFYSFNFLSSEIPAWSTAFVYVSSTNPQPRPSTHTHSHVRAVKMVSGVEDAVDDALNVLINVTEKSGDPRKDLRKDILEVVSKTRKEVAKLKCEVEDKTD